ncbi:alternate F1F0 ATPase, F1 subunit alpha [candidate division KSB1 bacterium]|nr:alternate F1F0 ATPase, F1 subunit alpha [candidate division KSB1 bacterium]
MNQDLTNTIHSELNHIFELAAELLAKQKPDLRTLEIGTVSFVGEGIARVNGLQSIKSDELVRFQGNHLGIAYDLARHTLGVILLDRSEDILMGSRVTRTHRVADVPVGDGLIGRMIDAVGRPLDEQGVIRAATRRPIEQPAPGIMDRAPVQVPLQTGVKVVDALIPIGRGQRELILGDRQTGKTAIAIDTIINQRDKDVICLYCGIGQRSSDIAKSVASLRDHDAFEHCIMVIAGGEDPPALRYIAPYAATTIGEYFMQQGRDVLIVYDDLTRHAYAYRELSLLMRRPPAREAYPGDIFYIHSRLLERSTHLSDEKGGGSLTALPIVETQAQNISAYIPTNLISITDGQIYLSPQLYRKGMLPAVDVGKSVSRVGAKTQLPAFRGISGDLRLAYSQFEELETFARFSTRLDEETRKTLERGKRVREVLKQPQYQPIPIAEQIAVLMAVSEGLFDQLPVHQVGEASQKIRNAVSQTCTEICNKIVQGHSLNNDEKQNLLRVANDAIHEEGE